MIFCRILHKNYLILRAIQTEIVLFVRKTILARNHSCGSCFGLVKYFSHFSTFLAYIFIFWFCKFLVLLFRFNPLLNSFGFMNDLHKYNLLAHKIIPQLTVLLLRALQTGFFCPAHSQIHSCGSCFWFSPKYFRRNFFCSYMSSLSCIIFTMNL